ncbi:unnamed protein product [Echinostoma caproni]|uniref:Carbohydrate deacetylase n=1 Tax=Echinostoma caproni TaxID=27848 RepID=A0A183AFN7_9TREM|nr:unnamed protein product [Echinostoma caproni]
MGKFGLRSGPLGTRDPSTVNLQQVELELEKQLCAFRTLFDAPPSHADGHQHIHVLPARVLPRHHVRWIRVPREHPDNFEHAENLSSDSARFLRTVSAEAEKARPAFISSGLKCTEAFIGMTLMGSHQTIDNISSCLNRLSHSIEGTTVEFMTHPGFKLQCDAPKQIHGGDMDGCGDPDGPDTFSCSSDREHEMQLLCGADFRNLLARTSWRLSTFRDLDAF